MLRYYPSFDFSPVHIQVSFGEDITKEAVLYSYDVPLSKNFMPKSLAVYVERYRRILKTHEEFQRLNKTQQVCLYFSDETEVLVRELLGKAIFIAMLAHIAFKV